MNSEQLQTLKVGIYGDIGYIQMYRSLHNNTINAINALMVDEITMVVAGFENQVKVAMVESLPEVLCFGGMNTSVCWQNI